MDRRDNPFAPGAGLQPPELAGRDLLIENASIDMERALKGRPTKSLLLLGLRGVGKTVLLNRLVDIADHLGFETAKVEAPEGGRLPELLAPELRSILYALDLRAATGSHMRDAVGVLRNFASAFKVKIGEIDFGLEPSPGRADTGNLQQDLPDLLIAVAQAAKERGKAVGLFIDEVQYLSPDELAAVIVSCHEIAQRNLPLFFVGAGLPQIAALAGNAKSYAERLFDFPVVDSLDAVAARDALEKPIIEAHAAIEPGAIAAILDVTRGYPYFIQEWGFRVWNATPESPIRLQDVEEATPGVIQHLDDNFFRVRFDRLTSLQQKYLRAMAELGEGPYKTGEIAATLGVEAAAVATVRQQLIDKGMVWSQRHGETAFTVPMFDAFMHRQMPSLEKHVPKRRPRTTK
jgi:AAA+ ATPase superfamily predicted ATPase